MTTREFSRIQGLPPPTIDNGAPEKLRLEWLSLVFDLATEVYEQATKRSHNTKCVSPARVYEVVNGTLGVDDAVQPYGGYLKRAGTNLSRAEWPRFYDLVLRLYKEFDRSGIGDKYISTTNEVLAAHGVVWRMQHQGRLERKLPPDIQAEVSATLDELNRPEYQAARDLFLLAKEAFDARPRRERDVGANAFDGLESTAKIRMQCNKTFGSALDMAKTQKLVNPEVAEVLRRIEILRHNHLGHGGKTPFALTGDEIDFVYVSCIMGARLFLRLSSS